MRLNPTPQGIYRPRGGGPRNEAMSTLADAVIGLREGTWSGAHQGPRCLSRGHLSETWSSVALGVEGGVGVMIYLENCNWFSMARDENFE